MTDVTAQQQQEPAAAPEPSEFDRSLDDFLGRDLMDEWDANKDVDQSPQVNEPAAAAPAPVPAPAPAPVPAAQPVQAPLANAGTPAANNVGATPPVETGSPEVDPNLLMEMFGGEPAPAAAPQPNANAQPEPQPSDEAPPLPFTSNMQLPPDLVSAIFESEDPVQRTRALTGLMAALGNACVQAVEQRQLEHWQPRMVRQFQGAQEFRQAAEQVNNDFFGAHPDLKPHMQIVTRASNVWAKANPGGTYNDAAKTQIANLARKALQQMGVQTPSAAAPTPAAPAPAAAPAPKTPYVAGGARPNGNLETPVRQDDPASMFDQMVGEFM